MDLYFRVGSVKYHTRRLTCLKISAILHIRVHPISGSESSVFITFSSMFRKHLRLKVFHMQNVFYSDVIPVLYFVFMCSARRHTAQIDLKV